MYKTAVLKIVCLLLVLVLFPSFTIAETEIAFDNHPAKIVGCWAIFISNASTYGAGDHSIVFTFNSDGTMSSTVSINTPSENTVSLSSLTGKWTLINSTIIYQREGKETYGVLKYDGSMIWFTMDTMSFGMKKIPDIDISQLKYVGD